MKKNDQQARNDQQFRKKQKYQFLVFPQPRELKRNLFHILSPMQICSRLLPVRRHCLLRIELFNRLDRAVIFLMDACEK